MAHKATKKSDGREYKLWYTSVIADGDSKTCSFRDKSYGEKHPTVKFECVGHVQKKMYN